MKDKITESNRASMILNGAYRDAMDVIKHKKGIALTKQMHLGLEEFFKEHKKILKDAGIRIKGVTD